MNWSSGSGDGTWTLTGNGSAQAFWTDTTGVPAGVTVLVYDEATVSGTPYCTVNGSGPDCSSMMDEGANTFALDRPVRTDPIDQATDPDANWAWGILTTYTAGGMESSYKFSGDTGADIWLQEKSANRLSFVYGVSGHKLEWISDPNVLTIGRQYQVGITYSGGTTGQNAADHAIYTSRFSISVVELTEPGAPTTLLATRGNQQVALTWVTPSDNGSAITDYLIEYSSDGGTNWSSFGHDASPATSATVTELVNGTEYEFRVKA
ncbi:MAG: fibronectin type III domain-containing protein, partial [Arenicellales bacterium]|nr:fibronectin type III domain-containing protein [Arenicellales bacterium]